MSGPSSPSALLISSVSVSVSDEERGTASGMWIWNVCVEAVAKTESVFSAKETVFVSLVLATATCCDDCRQRNTTTRHNDMLSVTEWQAACTPTLYVQHG